MSGEKNFNRALVILSGGLDSATLLYEIMFQYGQRNVGVVSFDYNQRHAQELVAARRIITAAGLCVDDHLIVDISEAGRYLRSSQTNTAIAVPHGHYTAESMKATVVPNRNMIMLAIAAGIAESSDYYFLAYGAHAGDHAIYADCRPAFVSAMSQALFVASDQPVTLLAPFMNSTKADIVRRGAELGVPFYLTYSCYEGGGVHCGKCGTCVERREAFKLAGVNDPTQYQ